MKPTTIDSLVRTSPAAPAQQALGATGPMDTGAIVLRPEQLVEAQKSLATLDFAAMSSGDVLKIALDAEQAPRVRQLRP